jgi:hypothetical protein
MLVPFATIRVQQAGFFHAPRKLLEGFLKPDRARFVDLEVFSVQAFHERARGKTMMRMSGSGHQWTLFDVRPMAG